MAKVKRNWELISEEYRKECIQEIIDFFNTEIDQDEEIGIIGAGNLLNYFLQTVGLKLYNKGVEDSIGFLKERLEDLELDMESIIKK